MKRRPGTRVIAHRGASGYLPEHTLEAKALAYGLGADFLEQDVVATRDGVLVVLHDIYLDDVSDVAARYPERRRADGHFYVLDFDLAEIRGLTLTERRAPGRPELLRPGRFAGQLGFRIATLEDELELIRGLNAVTGRSVGVYPEIKAPRWHREHGIDISVRLCETLERHGCFATPDLAFVQCFDAAELQRCGNELALPLPLIQLLDADGAAELNENPQAAARLRTYARGVGLPYASLLAHGALAASPLCERLEAADLLVHPYTFRADEPPDPAPSFGELLAFFMRDLEVDAVFCDHPDRALAARKDP